MCGGEREVRGGRVDGEDSRCVGRVCMFCVAVCGRAHTGSNGGEIESIIDDALFDSPTASLNGHV